LICPNKGTPGSPSHIFGIVTRCRSFTRVRLLLLPPTLLLLLPEIPVLLLLMAPLLLLMPPLLVLPLLLLPVTMATPSVGLKPSLSRIAGVTRDR
jgi:hypothetical protein